MHPPHRKLYNESFSQELYQKQTQELTRRLGAVADFRLAETPVFLSPDLEAAMVTSAHEIIDQLSRPEVLPRLMRAVPPRWDTPGMDELPALTQVDFAIVEGEDGRLVPRLIELQGFPSLSAFEVFQAEVWADVLRELPGLSAAWSPFFSGLDHVSFVELLRRVIVGDRDPETVVLLDLSPEKQKTWVDFVATQKLLGVDPVCPTTLEKEGRRLYRRKNGRRIPVSRIYNRIVFDELIKKQVELPFDFRDDLDVSWVPHPNWYWVWSKYTLPVLSHPAVPRATYLSELAEIPANLTEGYVLKPLFSFAGGGVNVDPTRADIERIPDAERSDWCLQEKITYAPCLLAVDGGRVKVEIRLMMYRPEPGRAFTLGLNLCRLSRGKMLGVDFNKEFTWVGSSVALRPAG